jgi:TonB family protein
MTTIRTDRAVVLTLLVLAFPVSPAFADKDEEEQRETDISDSSSERAPAVTTFPDYPRIARRDRIEGEATVCFKIAPSGRILEPAILKSTHKIFEKPALRAIKQSSFEPLGPEEELSATRTCRTFRFRLDPVVTSEA